MLAERGEHYRGIGLFGTARNLAERRNEWNLRKTVAYDLCHCRLILITCHCHGHTVGDKRREKFRDSRIGAGEVDAVLVVIGAEFR